VRVKAALVSLWGVENVLELDMLSHSRRLRSNEVLNVIATGRSLKGQYLSLRYITKSGGFRSAAVVSKKLAKTAVMRHRLRRSLYTALQNLSLTSEVQAVFFIKKIPPRPHITAFINDLQTVCSKQFS